MKFGDTSPFRELGRERRGKGWSRERRGKGGGERGGGGRGQKEIHK